MLTNSSFESLLLVHYTVLFTLLHSVYTLASMSIKGKDAVFLESLYFIRNAFLTAGFLLFVKCKMGFLVLSFDI